MSNERFDLISRYLTAANDVIEICGADALETLQMLLQAAQAEAAKGLEAAAPRPGAPSVGVVHPLVHASQLS